MSILLLLLLLLTCSQSHNPQEVYVHLDTYQRSGDNQTILVVTITRQQAADQILSIPIRSDVALAALVHETLQEQKNKLENEVRKFTEWLSDPAIAASTLGASTKKVLWSTVQDLLVIQHVISGYRPAADPATTNKDGHSEL